MVHEVTSEETVSSQVSIQYEGGIREIAGLPEHFRQVAAGLQTWIEDTRQHHGSSLFTRDKYVASDLVFDQMHTAKSALKDDDVVGAIVELTEALAFQGLLWESRDSDTADLFNQMAAEQNLDDLVRKMWREDFAFSQVSLGFWWDEGEFKIRGETGKGNQRKSVKKVWFPRLITVLDPERIVPVGLLAFGQERLAWRATAQEMAAFEAYLYGQYDDALMDRFYVDQYAVPEQEEQRALLAEKINTQMLILLNEQTVRRYTSTNPDYQRFPTVRLKSIFRLLDMKQQLLEADRVALVGAANYILLVKKGDKDNPAHPEEIKNLKANYHTLAKIPVIFSDHRLSVEIVTPKQDFTLQREKHDVLDGRIATRLLSGVASGSRSRGGQDSSVLLAKPAARAMENRRHMIRRFLEKEMARAVVSHPKNAGLFDEAPSLSFSPPNIVIEEDALFAQAILALRTQKELSRESVLQYFGFDQQVEAMRRQIEEVKYDDIFQTVVPFSSPAAGGAPQEGTPPSAQGGRGAEGGRPAGGGKPSQNPTKVARTAQGTTSPARSAASQEPT